MTMPARRSWWQRQRFLVLRRTSQLGILGLFLLGPWAGVYWLKGNLSSSRLLDTVPITDPFILLQSLIAGHWPALTALIGGIGLLLLYAIVAGRGFCAWVCPVNLITDAAAWLRQRLGLKRTTRLARHTRYALLCVLLIAAGLTHSLLWELFNPVNQIQRALIFGMGSAGWMILAIFVLDAFVSARAWCGHLCPMGAFYSLINRVTPIKVVATQREKCNDCADCYRVCPEAFVIKPALKGSASHPSPVIDGSECTSCGRCIDVCEQNVFRFANRFNKQTIAITKNEFVRREPS